MITFTTSLENIGEYPSLRLDEGARYFFDTLEGKVWLNSSVELREVISKVSSGKLAKGLLDDEENLVDLSNIIRRLNIVESTPVWEIGSDKVIISSGDIVIPKIQPKNGNIFTNTEHIRYIGSSELVEYKCDETKILPKFLFYLITSGDFSKSLEYLEGGKTHPRVNPDELLRYRIPNLPINKQKQFLFEIKETEDEIISLRSSMLSITDIINSTLISLFDFDFDAFSQIRSHNNYICDFSDFANNFDLRNSPKFHRPSGRYMTNFLKTKTPFRVKDFLSEPIVLGASVSPSDFSPDGEVYYISMASIKNFVIETDDTQLLSSEYANIPKNSKKSLCKNDIVMSRSGAAIGKFALVDSEISAIFADFIMRIRLKEVNHLFAYYFFRSIFTQYLIEIHKKGLQNQNIFPIQIQDFPFPDLSIEIQNNIVEQIKTKIAKQDLIIKEISRLRNSIDKTLLNYISI